MRIKFFGYYGGKYRMIDAMKAVFPPNDAYEEYYELYGGSGAMALNLFAPKRVKQVNELNPYIFNLWKVMADKQKGPQFIEKMWGVEYSRDRFRQARNVRNTGYRGLNEVEAAVEEYVLLTQSFNSSKKGYSDRKPENYQADNVWRLRQVYERVKEITVTNRNAMDVFAEVKGKEDAFVFLDPPYVHELRGEGAKDIYEGQEMKNKDQIQMLETVKDAKCKVMLCGYRGKGECLYDRILGTAQERWKCIEVARVRKPTNRKGETATEYIWLNYTPQYTAGISHTLIPVWESGGNEKQRVSTAFQGMSSNCVQ